MQNIFQGYARNIQNKKDALLFVTVIIEQCTLHDTVRETVIEAWTFIQSQPKKCQNIWCVSSCQLPAAYNNSNQVQIGQVHEIRLEMTSQMMDDFVDNFVVGNS